MTEINTAQKNNTQEVINMKNPSAPQPNTETNNQELLRIKTGYGQHASPKSKTSVSVHNKRSVTNDKRSSVSDKRLSVNNQPSPVLEYWQSELATRDNTTKEI
jgi:hypothetical protein